MRNWALWIYCLFAACGNGPVTQGPTDKYVVVSKCTPQSLTTEVDQHEEATLVVAFGPSDEDVLQHLQTTQRLQRPFSVSISEAPTDGAEMPDAVIVMNTGAAVAIDLALLACNGIAVKPNRVEIGARIVTPANRAAGGTTQLAPGDAFVQFTRMQHVALLTTEPAIDIAHSVGFIQTDQASALQAQIQTEVHAAAARYPQIRLLEPVAKISSHAPVAEQADEMVARGCRIFIVASSDPRKTQAIAAASANAPDGRATLIVLDPLLNEGHKTCIIGCPPESLGRAAASMVTALLPEGGAMIACVVDSDDSTGKAMSERRIRSFCQAMGFDAEQLLTR